MLSHPIYHAFKFTFQYGSIQIKGKGNKYETTTTIYIPIWFYSNISLLSILIFVIVFTFQYGSIQIIKAISLKLINLNLHSNMVLFKWRQFLLVHSNKWIYIPIWFYSNDICSESHLDCTFIYIPIWFYSNAEPSLRINLTNPSFTFQYGSIQIDRRTDRPS